MSDQAQAILSLLCKAVETDQIKLPTLPEVALKIRDAVEKDTHSAAEIAELLAQDSALSARLIQLANSPLYRTRNEVESLQLAITRLGVRIVKDLVVMLAIKQAFNTTNNEIKEQFREIWQTSIDVAAISRVLAKTQDGLDAEQAVLAGLIHNIGTLPIIELANQQPTLIGDAANLLEIINQIQGPLGKKILSFWNFPQALIDVVSQWNDFSRQTPLPADYVDIIQVAILHSQHKPVKTPENWEDIPAIKKLGLDPQIRDFDNEMQEELNQVRSSLMSI